MKNSTSSLEIIFKRRWIDIFLYLVLCFIITSPVVVLIIITPIALLSQPEGMTASSMIFLLVGVLVAGGWCWGVRVTIQLFVRRKSPLLIIGAKGIKLPHLRPSQLAWSEIACVEQVRISSATHLRLQLYAPERHLSRWQRLCRGCYRDSALIFLEWEGNNLPHAAYLAVKEHHSKYADI
jgi:hypothetical protein